MKIQAKSTKSGSFIRLHHNFGPLSRSPVQIHIAYVERCILGPESSLGSLLSAYPDYWFQFFPCTCPPEDSACHFPCLVPTMLAVCRRCLQMQGRPVCYAANDSTHADAVFLCLRKRSAAVQAVVTIESARLACAVEDDPKEEEMGFRRLPISLQLFPTLRCFLSLFKMAECCTAVRPRRGR